MVVLVVAQGEQRWQGVGEEDGGDLVTVGEYSGGCTRCGGA